jgi:hypothetical protein
VPDGESDMTGGKADRLFLDQQQDALVSGYVVEVTIPLLADGPKVLGTGTLFTHEDRHFIVTAAHILKVDENDPGSADIDLEGIAFPTGRTAASLVTLGSFDILRPDPSSHIDVVVFELKDQEAIDHLESGWRFLEFGAVAPFPFNARFILSGFPLEGASWDGQSVGQNFLMLTTDPLHYVPKVTHFEPLVDRFFHLEAEGELLDGSRRKIPRLQGLSGGSVWAYSEPAGIWSPSSALKVVAVQNSAKHSEWIRCAHWDAVRHIFRKPEIGFSSPP